LIYGELHAQAERAMPSQPAGHTLQSTALLQEAYLRLEDGPETDWQSRADILNVAAARRG
jgi:hypothetical protein